MFSFRSLVCELQVELCSDLLTSCLETSGTIFYRADFFYIFYYHPTASFFVVINSSLVTEPKTEVQM